MNARLSFTNFFKVLVVALAVIALVLPQAGVAAQTPDPWVPFCSGAGALVIQEESNTGDGVAMSAEDAVENWACGDTNQLVGFVEPWDGNRDRDRSDFPDKFNADSMVVGTAEQLRDFATRTGLDNGSWWLVDESYANHPLVVFADDATDADSLGLNPMENQIDLDRMGWVRERASDLYGVQKYVSEYAETDRLAQRMIALGWATVETSAPAVEEEPVAEEPVGMTAEQASADCDAIVPDPDSDGFYVCAPDAKVVEELVEEPPVAEVEIVSPIDVGKAFNLAAGGIIFLWIFTIVMALASLALWVISTVKMWKIHWLWGLAAFATSFVLPLIGSIVWLILHKNVKTWPKPASK